MKCHQCHEEVDPVRWKFCPHCGDTLADERIIYLITRFFKQRKIIYSILVLEVAFIGAVAFVAVNSYWKLHQKDQEIQQLLSNQKEVVVDWKAKEKIFPLTYVKDNQTLVDFKVSSESFTKLRAEVLVLGITATQTQVVNIKPGGNVFSLGPEITAEGYRQLSQSQKANVNIKLMDIGQDEKENKTVLSENKEVFFYAINDLSWNENGTNNAKYLARLVDKDRAEIKELVRKAADHMQEVGSQTTAMTGELADNDQRKKQLAAIFLALAKDYQVRYVMSPYSYDGLDVQQLRNPSQVLQEKSGLCIEIALTIAAALENIGLNPVIVVTAGHAWPGVQLSGADQQYFFIESTLLDDGYQEALRVGNDNWNQVKNVPGVYKLLKLTDLRSEGLLPIRSY